MIIILNLRSITGLSRRRFTHLKIENDINWGLWFLDFELYDSNFQVPVFVDRWPSVSIKHKKIAVLEIQRTDSATVR